MSGAPETGIEVLSAVLRACRANGVPACAEDVADAAWLARWVPALPQSTAEDAPIDGAEPPVAPVEPSAEPTPPAPTEPISEPSESTAPGGGTVGLSLPAASDRPGKPGGGTFRAPAAPALPRPLELVRALRPLARRFPSRTRFVLDPDRTAVRFADERVCDPVMRPAPERWLRLAVVVDAGAGSDLWRDTAREFVALLTHSGAFRDVRSWSLDTDASPPRLVPGESGASSAARDPKELNDPGGRTLTVVVSPCLSTGWNDGSVAEVLNHWAAHGPVALVALLPEYLWPRSALGRGAVVVSAPAAGVPNRDLRCTRPDAWPGEKEPTGVALPIAVLEPESLRAWAGLVAGKPGAEVPGVVLRAAARPRAAPVFQSAGERVEHFLQNSSPTAQRLIGLLAASPVVSLSVLRLIRESLLPGAGQPHEAEVLFGGLLNHTGGEPGDPRFDFLPGVRAELLRAVPTTESVAVLGAVSEYVDAHLASGRTFRAVLTDPDSAVGELTADESPFARIAAEVLLRVGGSYARLVRRRPRPAPQVASGPTRPEVKADSPTVREVAAQTAREPTPRRGVALVVGVSDYASALVPRPRLAATDANALADLLIDPEVCGFPADQVVRLIDADATRAAIIEYLSVWLPAQSRGADLVVIYFAGFGVADFEGRPEGCFLPCDANPPDLFLSVVSANDLRRCVDALEAEAVIVLFAYGDSWPARVTLFGAPALSPNAGKGRFLMGASEQRQTTVELVELGHGLFTHHLLKGIRGEGDRDGDGRVGVVELFEYVAEAVERDARGLGFKQRPWFTMITAGGAYISRPRAPRAEEHALASVEEIGLEDGPAAALAEIKRRAVGADEPTLERLLRQAGKIAGPLAVPFVVPYLVHASEAVRAMAKRAVQVIGIGRTFAAVEELARRGGPELAPVLDGLAAFEPGDDLLRLLDRIVDHVSGDLLVRATALLDRKRLEAGFESVRELFREHNSQYELRRVLGQGLYTAAYLAFDTVSEMEVVVRVLREEFVVLPEVRKQSLDVWKRSISIVHQNLVHTLQVRTLPEAKFCYTVRAYIDGVALRDVLVGRPNSPRQRFAPAQVIEILRQLLSALDCVHRIHMCHGGVKPSNIFICPGDRVVLGDLAPTVAVPSRSEPRLAYDFRYTSPEIFRGGQVEPRADIYSLGCVAYELFCGVPPFVSDRLYELATAHVTGMIPPARGHDPSLPAEVDNYLSRLLARDPSARPTAEGALVGLDTLRAALARSDPSGRESDSPVGKESPATAATEVREPDKNTSDADFDAHEVESERAGTRAIANARNAFFSRKSAAARWRDIQVVSASQSGPATAGRVTGRSLISRRPVARQWRYEQIIEEERLPADRIDYKLQIACASVVLEQEVDDLLAEPLRPSAPLLAAVVRAGGGREDERTAGFLDRWGTGQEPTTLGLVTMGILAAVRRGLARNEREFALLLERLFAPGLVAAIRANVLGPTLDRLRLARNAAVNPMGEFDESEYREFVFCLVGTERLADWESTGPDPNLPPDAGFLHRLLTGSRLLPPVDLPPAGTAIDRLTGLAAPRAGAFGLELVPYAPVAGQRFRDVSVDVVRAEPRFRIGGEVVLRVRAERNCHLTLIDLGTSGAVSLVLPNAVRPRPVLTAGESAYFPGPAFGDFAFKLHGSPGRERLIAVATTDPLPGLPAPRAGTVVATLSSDDLDRLADAVRALPGDQWSAAACEFAIEE